MSMTLPRQDGDAWVIYDSISDVDPGSTILVSYRGRFARQRAWAYVLGVIAGDTFAYLRSRVRELTH